MSYRIIWTESAKKSFEEVVEYLVLEWSQNDVNQFIDRTERVLSLISRKSQNLSNHLPKLTSMRPVKT